MSLDVGTGSVRLEFDRGTILLDGERVLLDGEKGRLDVSDATPSGGEAVDCGGRIERLGVQGLCFDERVQRWRAPARLYRDVVTALKAAGLSCDDDAAHYRKLDLTLQLDREPFPFQSEAVEAWWRAGGRGIVVLPTGAGKTFVAQLAMARVSRSTLIVVPTLDLLQQWYGVLSVSFDCEVGLIGGGSHELRDLTVTTYDSAYLHADHIGDRFGFVVFDECHHLPGPSYALAADALLAPYRLGLTATPEREDGAEWRLGEAIGPLVYRREIREFAGSYLAEYETVRLRVRLSAEEWSRYSEARRVYREFLARHQLRLLSPQDWSRFLALSSRSEEGRRAFFAHREQKLIEQTCEAKLRLLGRLLTQHRQDRVIVFTSDNDTVYALSRRFLIPAITHQTKVKERHEILQAFNTGRYPYLATSRVLNEGVDVPDANVGVVLSGSGSVREHVQRLGRILRRREGKLAVLYEFVAENTGEEFVSSRRRRHSAYR